MPNYDDLDREERADQADNYASAARLPEPPPVSGADSDDSPLDYLDSESLASWNLKRIRTALGISQQEISDRLKKSGLGVRLAQTQIAKIERGERPWRVNEMFAIVDVLEIQWNELFRGNGLSDDSPMVMLAARLKYQQAEEREAVLRAEWRAAAIETRNAGLEMCRTAARLGIKDESVMQYLRGQYFYKTWLDKFDATEPDWSLSDREESAEQYSECEWERYVSEAESSKLDQAGGDESARESGD